MGWWATGKLSNNQYKGYLLKCKKSDGQNFEAVVQSKNVAQHCGSDVGLCAIALQTRAVESE